jgi:hypothetical protein
MKRNRFPISLFDGEALAREPEYRDGRAGDAFLSQQMRHHFPTGNTAAASRTMGTPGRAGRKGCKRNY